MLAENELASLGKITLGNGSVVMYVVLSPAPPSSLCPKSADFGHKEDGGAGVYFRYCYVPQMISEIPGLLRNAKTCTPRGIL